MVPLRDLLYNLNGHAKRLLEQMQLNGGMKKLLAGKPRESRVAPPPQRKLSSQQLEILVRDYKAGAGSIYSLAKVYGISHHTVSAHLRAAGLKLGYKPMSNKEVQKAQKLRSEGLSLNAIGRALGRDPKTVKNVLV